MSQRNVNSFIFNIFTIKWHYFHNGVHGTSSGFAQVRSASHLLLSDFVRFSEICKANIFIFPINIFHT